MKSEITLKKTYELTDSDWIAYVVGFNETFHTDFTVDDFKYKYTSTCWGYSVHSLFYADSELVGSQSAIPEELLYKGEKVLLACSCDTFIRKDYRLQFDTLANLYTVMLDYLAKHEVEGIIGETYEKLLNYLCHTCGLRLIGHVANWVLPVSVCPGRIGMFINPLLRPFIKASLFILKLNKRHLFRGDELFTPGEYFTPCQYFSKNTTLANGKQCNYYLWNLKNHVEIVHDEFESVDEFATGVLKILSIFKYRVRAMEYRTGCRLPFPFICFRKKRIFMGKLLGNSISDADFYNIRNWKYKRGYFD